jgi:hypothetical protein
MRNSAKIFHNLINLINTKIITKDNGYSMDHHSRWPKKYKTTIKSDIMSNKSLQPLRLPIVLFAVFAPQICERSPSTCS